MKEKLMAPTRNITLGLLSPATPNKPHFKHVDALLPPGVSLIHEGLGLLGDAYQDLAGKAEIVIAKAKDFVARNKVDGLVLTGGFIGLFNPGIDVKVSEAIQLPVATAVSSAIAALNIYQAKSVLLMTPFDAKSDAVIKDHLNGLGFTVHLGPAFEGRRAGSGVDLTPDELFDLVVTTYRRFAPADAIYFQGATMDPLPIIQRLEDGLKVPVIASNPAMFWSVLSKLGVKDSVKGYGRLLGDWPAQL
jgi:maleate cis-trans isomerase